MVAFVSVNEHLYFFTYQKQKVLKVAYEAPSTFINDVIFAWYERTPRVNFLGCLLEKFSGKTGTVRYRRDTTIS